MWAILSILAGCTDEPVGENAAVILEPYLPEAERIVSVPVYGGTMESAPGVGGVVAADPEGNRLLRVVGNDVVEMDLGDNARPFRVHVEDTQAWVTLRGTGELASVALDTMTVDWRTRVCLEPRGVTRSPGGPLVVVCAGGELVEIDDEGGIERLVVLDADLRDVVATETYDVSLMVSRFTTAEILEIDAVSLGVEARVTLGGDAGAAWRMRPSGRLGVLVLHQRAARRRIELTGDDGAFIPDEEPPPYYGGVTENACGTIVETVITEVSQSDILLSASLERVTVGADFVVAADGYFAVTSAGAGDGGPDLLRFPDGPGLPQCVEPVQERVLPTPGRASAVALDVDGTLIVQSAAPFSLARAEDGGQILADPTDPTSVVQHLFHADPGVGVACASCHPEGLDDGKVWTFFIDPSEPMLRRTMPLAGEILARTPYHWDASHLSAASLMADTFVTGMGGSVEPDVTTALFDWLDGLRHVRAHPGADESAIAIGRDAFATAGCAACHGGAAFTTNTVQLVGWTTEPVKTPTLLGVGIRNNLLHGGGAYDLDERFGEVTADGHGTVSVLTDDELEALKAYLRTL